MPEFTKWVNDGKFDGGRLSPEQVAMRQWYSKLLRTTQDKAFTAGEFYGLNHANKENPRFGRIGDESVSGHWLYAFLRSDRSSGRASLVVANFHGSDTIRGASARIPEDARNFVGRSGDANWKFTDRLDSDWSGSIAPGQLEIDGLPLPDMPPCSALILEIGGE
jgi:hypothetical protein